LANVIVIGGESIDQCRSTFNYSVHIVSGAIL